MQTDITCYGWIPNLTGNIFLMDPFKNKSKFKSIDQYSDRIPVAILGNYKSYKNIKVKDKIFSDNKNDLNQEKNIIVYILDDKNPKKIIKWYVFIEDGAAFQLVYSVDIIEFDEKGLIKFVAHEHVDGNPTITNEFLNQIYIDIRDIYHEHTHHDGDIDGDAADSLIPLSINNENDAAAIKEILLMFQKKIVTYHKKIKQYINYADKSTYITVAVENIRQASGEYIYAQNFVAFYGKRGEIQEDIYSKLFSNVIQSMDVFLEELNAKYSHETAVITKRQNKLLLIMTFVLIALTTATIMLGYFTYIKPC
jgi:hypothetical protein